MTAPRVYARMTSGWSNFHANGDADALYARVAGHEHRTSPKSFCVAAQLAQRDVLT